MSECVAFAKEPADTNYDEVNVPAYELPNALIDNAGNAVDVDAWLSTRRAEVQQLFEDAIYGKTPRRKLSVRYELIESNPTALGGRATRKQVAAFFGRDEYRIDILLYIPNQVASPVAGFVGLNFGGNHTVCSDPEILLLNG